MGEMQFQDPPVTRTADDIASRDTGGFWRTLPGILTAAGSFLAGLAGLAAVIVPNVFPKSDPRDSTHITRPTGAPAQVMNPSAPDPPAPVIGSPPDAPAPAVATAPIVQSPPAAPPAQATNSTSAEPDPPASDRYVAAYASDGFVVLRSRPTIASAEITRIFVGAAVRCGQAKWIADDYRWRRCVDQDGKVGYMSDTFLRKA